MVLDQCVNERLTVKKSAAKEPDTKEQESGEVMRYGLVCWRLASPHERRHPGQAGRPTKGLYAGINFNEERFPRLKWCWWNTEKCHAVAFVLTRLQSAARSLDGRPLTKNLHCPFFIIVQDLRDLRSFPRQ